jgi:hypothetical protein
MGIYFPTIAALIIGFRLMVDKQRSKTLGGGLFFFAFSIALLVQNIWALFGFAHFYRELSWYAANGVFVNYPRFFALLGAVLPTITGFFLFCLIGLRLIVIHYRKSNLTPP